MLKPDLTYIFKCGCRHKTFHAEEICNGNQMRTARFCPACFNAEKPLTSTQNANCVLNAMEGVCALCGQKAHISKNTNSNIKLVLCDQHKHRRTYINRKIRNLNRPQNVQPTPKVKMQTAICPRCRIRHEIYVDMEFATKTPWKYCARCEIKKQDVEDNFVYGNDVMFSGKKIAL